MTIAVAATLEPVGEAHIALETVDVQANLRGLMSEVIVTQTYRNLENTNIEAVYTFPLPLDAVLLNLTLELNGKTLKGVVQPKADAEERYEEAIEDGDSAILLQELGGSLFTINVGNILPNEQAVIKFTYAQLHRWQGDSLRFHLPTTIAPRYGDPVAVGLEAHQIPEFALTVDRGFSLAIRIEGKLAQSNLDCPSHSVVVSTSNEATELSLSGGSSLMDRDFVLVLKESADSPIEVTQAEDNEEYLALASFHPVFPEDTLETPRCIKLVVDCSGSMSGDSIDQAKVAMHEILSLLKRSDHFNVLTFGSSFNLLFSEPVIATELNIRKAARFLDEIDADMGGTELGEALAAAYGSDTADKLSSDLLLITDGEVWDYEHIINAAHDSGHRIFSVGVGSAVSEAFVRGIAQTTSGACELVSPGENMADRIVRHFKRINQTPSRSVHIKWPETPVRQFPSEVEAVYTGDTLHVFGWFKKPLVGDINLLVSLEDGSTVTQKIPVPIECDDCAIKSTSLARVAAHAVSRTLAEDKAVELACRYQLVTEHTSCVLVFDRDEDQKSEDIPALRKPSQVLAAGWGGLGRVNSKSSLVSHSAVSHSEFEQMSIYSEPRESFSMSEIITSDSGSDMDHLSIPSFDSCFQSIVFSGLVDGLNNLYSNKSAAHLTIGTIRELVDVGLEEEIGAKLRKTVVVVYEELTQDITDERLETAIADAYAEVSLVICFLALLSNSEMGKDLSRHAKRVIHKANKKNVVKKVVSDALSNLINDYRMEYDIGVAFI